MPLTDNILPFPKKFGKQKGGTTQTKRTIRKTRVAFLESKTKEQVDA